MWSYSSDDPWFRASRPPSQSARVAGVDVVTGRRSASPPNHLLIVHGHRIAATVTNGWRFNRHEADTRPYAGHVVPLLPFEP
jgi:hypothetical protein